MIRLARADDAERIGELWLEMVAYHQKFDDRMFRASAQGAARYAENIRRRLSDRSTRTLVAEARGEIVGYALGMILDITTDMFMPVRSGFVADIYVRAAHRRQGWGRQLVERLVLWFQAQDVECFEWHLAAGNQDARKFWEAIGGRTTMLRMRAEIQGERVMTELIYLQDSYVKTFNAVVAGHNEQRNGAILDRSAFYPGGGGQPCDQGKLLAGEREYTVSQVKRGGLHIIEGELPPVGAEVQGIIDWDRRYKLMRTHTAMHILCGVIWRDYQASVTGGNMDVLSGRMDFEFERLAPAVIAEIEVKINQEVAAARDLSIQVLPREEAFQIPDLIRTKINLLPASIKEVRTVEIDGLDLQADGGTHVANTSEVGTIKISKYKSKGGINKRLYVEISD